MAESVLQKQPPLLGIKSYAHRSRNLAFTLQITRLANAPRRACANIYHDIVSTPLLTYQSFPLLAKSVIMPSNSVNVISAMFAKKREVRSYIFSILF